MPRSLDPDRPARRRHGPAPTLAALHAAQHTARWTGPVVRPPIPRLPPVLETWRCQNPYCGQWAMDRAFTTGRCNFCQTPRGAREPQP